MPIRALVCRSCAVIALLAPAPCAVHAELIYGYTNGGSLVSFDSANPNAILSTNVITGLNAGDALRGIDFRASNGALYGLGAQSRLYTIDVASAAATQVGAAPFSPSLSDASQGMSFDPISGALRIIGAGGQNLRIDADTGGVIGADTALSGIAGAGTVGLAYDQNGAAFIIDFNNDVLAALPDPVAGVMTAVGALGINAQSRVGFDVSDTSGVAFASMFLPNSMGRTSLYSINTATGAATNLGAIGPMGGLQIDGIAVVPIPDPAAVALLGVASASAGLRRRRA